MAMQTGERYRCPTPDCGCEIQVTKGAGSKGGAQPPRCSCGSEMQLAAAKGGRGQAAGR